MEAIKLTTGTREFCNPEKNPEILNFYVQRKRNRL